ncbi:[protein-PII] uridylyltransferase [Endozoicomonas sp. (ex Bugula neritina AB1)]|nr:[protein-PII] uridylyltransferase [Endozoicomonas sp. (ex Bugula neritina AB1)]
MSIAFHNIPEEMQQLLFDKGQFRADLTISATPIPAYKKVLHEATLLMDKWFREDVDIEVLVQARAWLIDQIIKLAWEHLNWNTGCDIAILAVGGYGRGELHPSSDIDILILLETEDYASHQNNIEQCLTLLWDIGLKIGSSVRSLDECQQQASSDLTIITNLMESRMICGPNHLYDKLEQAISTEHMWPGKVYLQAKYEEQRARHKKYNDTGYDLEPNIKGSPGALRDLHMLGWVARRHYGTHDPSELLRLNFLTETECHQLKRCQAFLWKIRWALHTIAKRGEDRLLFDHQRTLAEQFGYHDHKGSLAVEQFMQSYFRTVMILSQLKDLLLQHFSDDILNAGEHLNIRSVNTRFQICNQYIEVIHDNVFTDYPPAILEIFVLMTRDKNIQGIQAETIRLIRNYRHLIDHNFRKDPRCTRLFLELMRAPFALTITLRRMAQYGILGRYLPEFGRIIGQMQYDLFHTLTVDAHTLLLVKFLRSFSYEQSRSRFPVAARVIHTIPKRELLYLAGLYHDIGKGQGGDHSQLGAQDAEKFCRLHGLGKEDTDLIVWLVREHLTMSVTAQKQDLSDPKVIQDFARKVGSRERLKYLYTLTVADINATNPSLWNDWRASLLQQLYKATREMLKRGIDNLPEINEQIQNSKETAFKLLEQKSFNRERVFTLWHQFSDRYFIRHQPDEIAWQTAGILQIPPGQPLVMISEPDNGFIHGGSNVFVYTKDTTNLFAACVAALDQLGLDIQDAKVITTKDGYSVDTFTVLEADSSSIGSNRERILQIRNHMNNTLANPDQFPELIKRRTPRQLRHFSMEPVVLISNKILTRQTVLDIITTDRPGLLALIGKTFTRLGLQVHDAKIATFGEKVEDSFIITDQQGRAITDALTSEKICNRLSTVLRKASQLDVITP